MKPDWKAAPDWAEYLSQDRSGKWMWCASKPVLAEHVWEWDIRSENTRWEWAVVEGWKETLERRPSEM